MATAITSLTPAIPPTEAVADPAARSVVRALAEAIQAMRSGEFALSQLESAARRMTSGGGTPPSIAQWLFSSKVYQAINTDIEPILIEEILKLAPVFDPGTAYVPGDVVLHDDVFYRALLASTGQTPPDAANWVVIGTFASLGTAIAGIIENEREARAEADQALVNAVNTMWAITGATEAISQVGTRLITNWGAAEANYWNTLNAEVFTAGGQTIRAALSETATVAANLAGDVEATWTVRADVNGHIAGIGLGVEGGPGTTTSTFVVQADKFALVMPGYGNYVPFAIGPSGAEFSGLTQWAGVSGTGRPQDFATVGANLALPFDQWDIASQSIETITDGKVGPIVLRLVNGGGHPNQPGYIPIDYSKKYRVRFWARPASGTGGVLYFSLRQFTDDAGTAGPTNGGRAPYKPNAVSVAAHGGAGVWKEYAYTWDSADWQAGVKYFQPEFLESYGSAGGYWDIQPVTIEIVEPITASNVTTYIDNVAINAAQIAKGNIFDLTVSNTVQSDNYNGSVGWYVNRSGVANFLNVIARGDIEASSIKAGSANIIDTLMLQGQAVTIPLSVNGAYNLATLPNTNFGGANVILLCYADDQASDASPLSISLTLKHNGSNLKVFYSPVINGSGLRTTSVSGVYLVPNVYTATFSLQASTSHPYAAALTLVALGTKR